MDNKAGQKRLYTKLFCLLLVALLIIPAGVRAMGEAPGAGGHSAQSAATGEMPKAPSSLSATQSGDVAETSAPASSFSAQDSAAEPGAQSSSAPGTTGSGSSTGPDEPEEPLEPEEPEEPEESELPGEPEEPLPQEVEQEAIRRMMEECYPGPYPTPFEYDYRSNSRPVVRSRAFAAVPSVTTAVFSVNVQNAGGSADTSPLWLHLSGPIETSLPLSQTEASAFEGLPYGQYTATLILPQGYSVVGIYAQNLLVSESTTFTMDASSPSLDIELRLSAGGGNPFYSSDSAKNELDTDSWNSETNTNYRVDINATSMPGDPPYYYDLVLILDMSGSMANSMDGRTTIAPVGQRRIDYLIANVKELIDTLVESAPADSQSRISIVNFNDWAEVALEWTYIKNLDTQQLYTEMDAGSGKWSIYGATMADLGFKYARDQFAKPAVADSQNTRHVIFFTDGMPANTSNILPPNEASSFWSSARFYPSNYFRVMAEVLNQVKVLTGARGETIENVNEFVNGYPAPGYGSSAVKYYGTYFTSSSDAQLQQAWDNYHNLSVVPPCPTNSNPSTFASRQGGSWNRKGTGCGAQVYSVGIFEGEHYVPEVKRIISDFMRRATTNPDENFFTVSNADELYLAFRNFSGGISGSYENVYVRYYVDDAFAITNNGGGTEGIDTTGGVNRRYLEWGPFSMDLATPFNATVRLQSIEGDYTGPPPGTALRIGIMERDIYVEIGASRINRQVNVQVE